MHHTLQCAILDSMSDENIQNEEKNMQDYELGLHLIPTLEDKTQEVFDAIKASIEKVGGTVTADSNPVLIPLAYQMVKKVDSKNYKYNTASFGWIKFTTATTTIEELKEVLDLHSDILRYLLLKTTADSNTPTEDVARFLSGDDEEVSDDSDSSDEDESVTEHEDKGKDIEDEEDKNKESTQEDIDKKVDEAIDAITEESEEK